MSNFLNTLRSYRINPSRYIKIVKFIAQSQGYNPERIEFSDNPNKKLSYTLDNGKKVHFGANGYLDYILYLILRPELAEEMRRRYRARATETALQTEDKYSPANLSLKILWT